MFRYNWVGDDIRIEKGYKESDYVGPKSWLVSVLMLQGESGDKEQKTSQVLIN